jgi:cytoskeletal protein RodZ
MKLRTEVGKRIRQIRDALNLTQEDICKSISMSTASLSGVETGKYKAVQASNYWKTW